MRGTTPRREQGMADPVLASMVHAIGLETAQHYTAATPKIKAYRDRWAELAKFRDGPVNPQRVEVTDPVEMAKQIKIKAIELGANMVGICRLQPYMIDLGEDVPHGCVIVACVAEDYEKVLHGASFRPGFVTTDLPLAEDKPREFGVQDFCMNCNVCMLNCPGDAIPKDHVMTHGIKRWLIDLEKCYPYSRLRDEYCHLCVDVCPYNVKSHPETYKTFMKERKQVGYKTPKSW